jgi:hypothetical protein
MVRTELGEDFAPDLYGFPGDIEGSLRVLPKNLDSLMKPEQLSAY